MPQLYVVNLGHLPYARAWELQREAAKARIAGEIPEDLLLLVEHPPVVTMGRSSKESNLVVSRELLAGRGVELYEVERGGDVTFHGPGQLVGYPIVDLKRHRQDLHWYLRQIEESLIRAIAGWALEGHRVEKYTGVWVGGGTEAVDGRKPEAVSRKLASIGVHARDWVTWHGFALNVTTDLRYFDLIVPCGIQSVTMTSMARELGRGPDAGPTLGEVGDAVAVAMADVFGLEAVQMPVEWLRSAAVALAP
ncbi:MAG TPA: lipoyl(octanoyl) transferase LipB [Gemmatimonadaceae bacterium]|nr:lipoyl(octanoyl) transferase LipB [Gemmatimonadaceae bacterium]